MTMLVFHEQEGLYDTKRGPNESFFHFEARFRPHLSTVNSLVPDLSLAESLCAF